MLIEQDDRFKADLIRRIAEREFSERTGIHTTDLIYCLNKQALRRTHPIEDDEHTILLYSLGWSTQRWLTGQDQDEPEITVDGITVTMDALWGDKPYELKATYQSSNKPIEDNINWIRQLMSQAYVGKSLEVYLTRLEIMGDWGSVFGKKEEKSLPEHRKPSLSAYHIRFELQELERHWEWMLERRDLFQKLLDGMPLLPMGIAVPKGNEFECGYCPYKGNLCAGLP